MPKLTIKEIASIKNALQIIQENADLTITRINIYIRLDRIVEQVARIDKLLPKEQK